MHPEKISKGEVVKHNGSFVVELGEHSGHRHILTVERPADLEIRKDDKGNFYFHLKAAGTLSHDEHKTLTIAPGIYRKSIEREVDHFSESIMRVQD